MKTLNLFWRRKQPEKDGAISECMRNASGRERECVFMKAIDESIADQRKIIERSEQLRRQRAVAGVGDG